jgi:hypothetical protein
LRGRSRGTAILTIAIALLVVGCGMVGASQITVNARNDSEQEMEVGVVAGMDDGAPRHGTPVTLAPGESRDVTLDVPGGDWTVTVNGLRLLSTSDVGSRRGTLPVTVVLPDPADFPAGPYWEAPSDWAETAP